MSNLPEACVYGLFCLCHPGEGIRYVGMTEKTPETRFRAHLASTGKNRPVYSWIKSHGPDNIGYSVLEVCTAAEVFEREQFWISELGTRYPLGKNMTDGGDGIRGFVFTAEHRQKMSDAHIGHRASDETRAKMSAARSGAKAFYWGKTGADHPAFGHKHQPEFGMRMSIARSGENGPRAKLSANDVREIRRLLGEGKTKNAEIARIFNISPGTVTNIKTFHTWKNVK